MVSASDFNKKTVAELKEELGKRDLSTEGKKADLIARLVEAIQKAEEDALLNCSGDVTAVPNDDLLKNADDLLSEEPSATEEKADEVATSDADAPSKGASLDDKEKKLKRAQRLGLPISTTEGAADDAKKRRAERFGLNMTNGEPTEEKLAKRAERFGGSTDEGTKSKLIERAQRFGIPVGGEGKTVSKPVADADALTKRAKRFAMTTPEDPEMDAKKKARLERFGGQCVHKVTPYFVPLVFYYCIFYFVLCLSLLACPEDGRQMCLLFYTT